MKLSGFRLMFFASAAGFLFIQDVFAQNNEYCQADKLKYQCPIPSGTTYTNQFGNYVKNISLSTSSSAVDPENVVSDIVLGMANVVIGSAAGYIPGFNAFYQVINFATGLTSLHEESTFPVKQIEVALNNIIQNINEQIDDVYDYIDERYDDLQVYTESLVASETYLGRVKTYRSELKSDLDTYHGRLASGLQNGWWINTTDLSEDIPESNRTYLSRPLENALEKCVYFFGSIHSDTNAFDDGSSAKDRLVYAADMCSGCMSAYALHESLSSSQESLQNLRFTMERCMLDVIPLAREHIQDEVDKVAAFHSGVKAGGRYDGETYFEYQVHYDSFITEFEEHRKCSYPANNCRYWSEVVERTDFPCYSTCDRIKSCTSEEFAPDIDYICKETHTPIYIKKKHDRQRWTENYFVMANCPGYDELPVQNGAYPKQIAGACIGFGKQQIDNELMNYYRSSLLIGYGDIWAQSLAKINSQGLILSGHAPLSEGPFAIQSRQWGAFVHGNSLLYCQKGLYNKGSRQCYGLCGAGSPGPCPDSGFCGGSGCGSRDGGSAQCCDGVISRNNRECSGPDDTGCFVPELIGSLKAEKTYFKFVWIDGSKYRIQSTENHASLCDGIYCEWTVIPLASEEGADLSFGEKDTTLYTFKNSITGGYLSHSMEPDYKDEEYGFKNEAQIPVYTSAVFDPKHSFRIIRECGKTGFCFECETDNDCPGSLFCQKQEEGNVCKTPAFTSKAELRDAIADLDVAIYKYGPIGKWDVSNITDFTGLFTGMTLFNEDISQWDTSKVKSMAWMFQGATSFNQNIGGWNTTNVSSMVGMFAFAGQFNKDIGGWDVSNCLNMMFMFYEAHSFDQNIGGWDTGKVSKTNAMFENAASFNQPLGTWDTAQVLDMQRMFYGATSFNQDISRWDVAKVTYVWDMFVGATSFEHPLCWEKLSPSSQTDEMGVVYCPSFFSIIHSPTGKALEVSDCSMSGSVALQDHSFDSDRQLWNYNEATQTLQSKHCMGFFLTSRYGGNVVIDIIGSLNPQQWLFENGGVKSASGENKYIHSAKNSNGDPRICGCKSDLQHSYRGTVSTTKDGQTCQNWDSNEFHTPNRFVQNAVAQGKFGLGSHNHCRNPDNMSGGAWCYTTDPGQRWEYCDVPVCNDCGSVPDVVLKEGFDNMETIFYPLKSSDVFYLEHAASGKALDNSGCGDPAVKDYRRSGSQRFWYSPATQTIHPLSCPGKVLTIDNPNEAAHPDNYCAANNLVSLRLYSEDYNENQKFQLQQWHSSIYTEIVSAGSGCSRRVSVEYPQYPATVYLLPNGSKFEFRVGSGDAYSMFRVHNHW